MVPLARLSQTLGSHTVENSSLAKMREFYELFPYPNRPLVLEPESRGLALSHAGFASLAARGEIARCEYLVEKQSARGVVSRADMVALNKELSISHRILSVGCGTDEPLLLRKLHRQSEIVGIDLSQGSIDRAKEKIRAFRFKSFFRFRRVNPVTLLAGDAETILKSKTCGKFDHIQCFGVLHHQSEPEKLMEAMANSLQLGGTLRLMIYSNKGRRLERRIQKRFSELWETQGSSLMRRLRIKFAHLKLVVWQFLCFFFLRNSKHYRFRYLGLNSASVADALLHPSDPGLNILDCIDMAKRQGLKLVYCEGKCEKSGALKDLRSAENTAKVLAEADARQELLSNFTCIFVKAH